MKLETFVADTISQIITGVKKAQEFAKENGARVNPGAIDIHGAKELTYWDNYNRVVGQIIEFDVSITTREEGQTEGSAGVFVSILKAGIKGKDSNENIAINRIKFAVPVFLPMQNKINE